MWLHNIPLSESTQIEDFLRIESKVPCVCLSSPWDRPERQLKQFPNFTGIIITYSYMSEEGSVCRRKCFIIAFASFIHLIRNKCIRNHMDLTYLWFIITIFNSSRLMQAKNFNSKRLWQSITIFYIFHSILLNNGKPLLFLRRLKNIPLRRFCVTYFPICSMHARTTCWLLDFLTDSMN